MSKKIVLVDDEEVFHWITKQFIERIDEEIPVLSFYNGKEAIDFLERTDDSPDALLLDINMPIANGWVFLNEFPRVKDEHQNLKIFVVSSSIDPEDMKRAKSYTYVDDFISKPITIEILEEMLAD